MFIENKNTVDYEEWLENYQKTNHDYMEKLINIHYEGFDYDDVDFILFIINKSNLF